jgi:hypothetical protein
MLTLADPSGTHDPEGDTRKSLVILDRILAGES